MGTIINTLSIVIGGILGNIFGKYLKKDNQTTIINSCAVAIMFIGIAGAMEGLLTVSSDSLISSRSMFIVICLALGAIIGEIIDIEGKFESFGSFIKVKSGHAKDKKFIDGFSTASFTVCIGAMAIIGSIKDGLVGDYSILATKSVLDLIIIMIFIYLIYSNVGYIMVKFIIIILKNNLELDKNNQEKEENILKKKKLQSIF